MPTRSSATASLISRDFQSTSRPARPISTRPSPALSRPLGKTLVRAGVTWDDVVQVNSVHTDVNAQIDAMVKVKNRYMTGKLPAWTAVGTNGLLQPGGIAEITLVAHVPKGAK